MVWLQVRSDVGLFLLDGGRIRQKNHQIGIVESKKENEELVIFIKRIKWILTLQQILRLKKFR